MKKLTTQEFIDRAKLIHGDKYDYTNTIYTGSENPVNIFCKKHNIEFVQSRASKHLSGCGCPKCGKEAGGKAKKDKSKFLQKKGETFIKEAQKLNPDSIVSYCEKNKFSGISYLKCGFSLERESEPGYSYYKNNQKFSRVSFQKFKLKDKLEKFNPDLTETENMLLNGYYKLYDYGNFVFIKHYNHQ